MTPLEFSNKQVRNAGKVLIDKNIRNDSKEFNDAMDILSYWRSSHEEPLDYVFNQLQLIAETVNNNCISAKRLKRLDSITNKLERFDKMKLNNIQDIGGCRVILPSNADVIKMVRKVNKTSKFSVIKHNDYIKEPKKDGYRSYHLVTKVTDENNKSRRIEIQLRSRIQHYWATALEIIDLFTGQSLKFSQGEVKWADCFKYIGSQFELMDEIKGFYNKSGSDKFRHYKRRLKKDRGARSDNKKAVELITKLELIEKLKVFSQSINDISKITTAEPNKGTFGYVLLTIKITKIKFRARKAKIDVQRIFFGKENSEIAEQEYKEKELEAVNDKTLTVALISSNCASEINTAYPNYFADSNEFVKLLNLILKVNE